MNQENWILKEKDLFPPLKSWLKNNGYKVYAEVLNKDVIAKKDDEFVGFELKMSCSKKGIQQAYNSMIFCGKAYIVISSKPKSQSVVECKKRGIGIIRINNILEILLEAKLFGHRRAIDFYLNQLDFDKMEEGEISGRPNMKGEGPAQELLKDIKIYLKLHPKATWKEIYNNVQNHYSNYKSLANSMRSWQGFKIVR